MKKILTGSILVAILLSTIIGCAPLGPSIIKTYQETKNRGEIAIIRADESKGLAIIRCDGANIKRGAKYILLNPGRHEVWFSISGQTLLETYWMTNKLYVDVAAGHTYILKSKGGGIFAVGDKWFPESIDVTEDYKFHLQAIPVETVKND